MPEGYNGVYTGQQIDAGIAKANQAITVNGSGTVSMEETLGDGPYTIEVTEESDEAFGSILTFGSQSVATTAWSADTTYDGYSFRASIPLSGVNADYVPSVTFGIADATSSNLAPVADSYAGGVYIYAKEQPSAVVSIASIICVKGA